MHGHVLLARAERGGLDRAQFWASGSARVPRLILVARVVPRVLGRKVHVPGR